MIMYRVIEMEYNKYSLQCSLFDKMLFISDTVRARIFPYCHYYSAKIRKYRRIDDGYSAITIIPHESFKRSVYVFTIYLRNIGKLNLWI